MHGVALLEGVLIGRGAVIGAGVTLTGTSRLYDLVHGRVLGGTTEAPLVVPPGAVVVPGIRVGGRLTRSRHGDSTWSTEAHRNASSRATRALVPASRCLMRMAVAIDRPCARPNGSSFGTPLYVYDLDVIDGQVAALRYELPPNAELAYAVKANPALAIVTHLGALGLGADVASGGELATALRAGIPAGRIVMTGPGKRDAELRSALEAGTTGIRAVTVESLGELGRLDAIARDIGRRQPVMLRAAVAASAGLERVRLVGDDGAGKFGMDAADLVDGARFAVRSPHLELLGLHAFGASNVLDASALVAHVAATGRAARELARVAGTTVHIVDAGGGLGIPYATHEASLDVVTLGRGLAAIVESWAGDALLADARLLLEPGRFLVGPAGAYLARVVDVKTVDGITVAVLDGGVHHVLRPALVGQEHRVRLFRMGGAGRGRSAPVTVVGPLCSGLDVLAVGAMMAVPRVGDLLAVLDVGAYGFTESMPYFLSHPIPPEVVARGGQAACIRPRLDPGEWLDRQLVPDLVTAAVSSGRVPLSAKIG